MLPRVVSFFMFSLLLCLLSTSWVEAKPAKEVRSTAKYTDWRLPRWVLPRQYKLRLLPYLKEGNFTIDGRVEILLECIQETQMIVLHMADISIAKEGLQVHDLIELRRVGIHSYTEDKTRQFLVIGTKNETLRAGKFYRLTIQFTGQLNDKLNGFYRATYLEDGVTKFLATTQFSPTDARRAFPCFDEPGFKAKFQTILGRHKSFTASSNMPLRRTVPNEDLADYVWDEFETTLPMSTYVLAFIIHQFKGIDSPEEAGSTVRFRTWTRPSAINQTEYARIAGPKMLRFFENYFNISFPLPKQDMMAIPDFAGAMENWGLVTYRETALLYDPSRSSVANRQRVISVIAHELAHQWFGNLVTMEWWGDLWLKEGFATYLEYVGPDAIEPGLQYGQQFTVDKLQNVFAVDALASSHPMSMVVNKRNEVNELFDSIPYSKGPTVIRMLASFMGQALFRRGLTLYLNNRKFQNAQLSDLWTAMNNQTTSLDLPADIETIMNSWSLQTGYPMVSVQRDYGNQSAVVFQERFYLDSAHNSSDFPLWWIPLTFTADFNSTYTAWMMGTEDGIELELSVPSSQWLIFNIDQVGYYRVNYDVDNWRLITDQLRHNHSAINVLNRAQLIDDSFNIARTGALRYSVPFGLGQYLRMERSYVPWKSALSALNYLDRLLYYTDDKDTFRNYMKWLISPAFEDVGFEQGANDTQLTILHRDQMLSWACKLDIPECVNKSTAAYKAWMQDPDNQELIHPNYRRTIVCSAIAAGGDEEWDFALERYLSTDLSSEKEMLLGALGCTASLEALNTLLEWSLDPKSGIRRQDALAVFSSVGRNPQGQSLAFDFALKNWDRLVKSFPSLYVLGRLMDSITLTLNTEEELDFLTDLSDGGKGDLGTAARTIRQAVERTRINLDWMKKHHSTVSALLKSWAQRKTLSTAKWND